MTYRSYLPWLFLILPVAVACGALKKAAKQNKQEIDIVLDATDVHFTMHHTRFDPATRTFNELTPPPKKRNLFSIHELKERIYLLGGLNEAGDYVRDLECYDDAAESWKSLAPWPRPGLAYSTTVADALCAFAGFQKLNKPLRRELDCYFPADDEWRRGPDLPEAYSSAFPATYGGRIYLFGGSNEDGELFDRAWSYAPGDAAWRAEPALPEGRAFMGAQAVGDKVYVIGGFGTSSFKSDDTGALQDRKMYAFDPKALSWAAVAAPPYARALYGLADIKGKLAVFFGFTNGPLIELYDPATDTWSSGKNPPRLPNGGVYTYAQFRGELHLLAIADGITSTSVGSSGTLWHYDDVMNHWSIAGQRGAQYQDALFWGKEHAGALHWVGAHTGVSLDVKQIATSGTGGSAFNAALALNAEAWAEVGQPSPLAPDAGGAKDAGTVSPTTPTSPKDAGIAKDAASRDASP